MKLKKALRLSILAIALGLTGCIVLGCAPYQSKFKVGGNSFTLPKDAKFDWMQVSIPTTNGPISLVISNGTFKMNPAVIDAKTAHDVAVMGAVNALVQSGIAAGMKGVVP